MFGASVR